MKIQTVIIAIAALFTAASARGVTPAPVLTFTPANWTQTQYCTFWTHDDTTLCGSPTGGSTERYKRWISVGAQNSDVTGLPADDENDPLVHLGTALQPNGYNYQFIISDNDVTTPTGPRTARLFAVGSEVGEGQTAYFDLVVDGHTAGSIDAQYTISGAGITASDFTSNSLFGTYTIAYQGADYKRGILLCESDKFEALKEEYNQDPQDEYTAFRYAACLMAMGQDQQALQIWDFLSQNKNSVTSAFHRALYYVTGGAFKGLPYDQNINLSLKEYFRVLFLIDLNPYYPEEDKVYELNKFYELKKQMELRARYFVPLLYLLKYGYGVIGHERSVSHQDPTYTGPRGDTYPEYAPYTADSLMKAITYANECLVMPQKEYYNTNSFQNVKRDCQLFQEIALKLEPLEQKRRNMILQVEACKYTDCPEYKDLVLNQIQPLWYDVGKVIKTNPFND